MHLGKITCFLKYYYMSLIKKTLDFKGGGGIRFMSHFMLFNIFDTGFYGAVSYI